jgi:DNA-binding SARP family transcriptional activator
LIRKPLPDNCMRMRNGCCDEASSAAGATRMASGCLKRLAGTYLVARPLLTMPAWPAIEEMGRAPLAALAAPCDFLAVDKVATVVQERYADVVWIRLGTVDADPGALLVALLGAVERLDAEASLGIAEAARRHARFGEWQMAYKLLARRMATTARPTLLVLEGVEHLEAGSPSTLDLLVPAFLAVLPGNLDVLLIGFKEWDSRRLDPHGHVLGPSRLRLDRRSATLLAEASCPEMPPRTLDRSFALTRGAAGALQAAFSAGAVLGAEAFGAATARAATGHELLSALGRSLLSRADEHTMIALSSAGRLGIWHPGMATALGHPAVTRSEPWWVELTMGWRQLNPAWRAPLLSTGGAAALDPASLILLADHLARQGAGDQAFDLYTQAGAADRAADTAMGIAHDLASAGCWATLARMGGVLAHDSPAARHSTEPNARTCRIVPWWRDRFVRRGRRSADWAMVSFGVRVPDVATQAAAAPAPAAVTLRQARRAVPVSPWPVSSRGVMIASAYRAPYMTAHLLGEFRVTIRDHPVEAWASGRGRAVFEYLLVHRHSKVQRERLMSVFWPDASPDAARNSLNVAIHGLRQSLRNVAGDTAVVIHRNHAYFIEPTLEVWVDIEAFEEQLKSAHQHLASAELVKGQMAFEAAICLYQGEFLADDPYEEWAVVLREHLRLCYLDSLDRLGMLRLNSDDYAGCVEICLKLLAYDNCREDVYCRLMRCYSRQGQVPLALRQYHSCAATLRRELGVTPTPATTELYNRIRRREPI